SQSDLSTKFHRGHVHRLSVQRQRDMLIYLYLPVSPQHTNTECHVRGRWWLEPKHANSLH
ncbi:hypothetical protein ACJMK2_039011, partial [Sinanodonta woodiana]